MNNDYVSPDPIKSYPAKLVIGPSIKPQEPMHIDILGSDGYETFIVDESTVGVRPKWISVSERLPEKVGIYWVCFEFNGRLKSHYCLWEEKSRLFGVSKCGWRSREAIRRSNIKYWMPLPNPPEKNE